MFNIFKRSSASLKPGLELNFSKDFVDQDCQCIQQELDLSELTWMDTSAYQHSKKMLKKNSSIAIKTYLGFNPQRDLFE